MSEPIEVRGLKEVQKALYSYSQQLGDRVVLSALRQGANLIKKAAVQNAPKNTGALKKSLRVSRSKIYSGKLSTGLIGLYLTIRKGGGRKDPKDAFYGRWIESGWNVRGRSKAELVPRKRQRALGRGFRRARNTRQSLPGSRDISGLKFIERAFLSNRESALRLIIQSAERGAEIIASKTGLK